MSSTLFPGKEKLRWGTEGWNSFPKSVKRLKKKKLQTHRHDEEELMGKYVSQRRGEREIREIHENDEVSVVETGLGAEAG